MKEKNREEISVVFSFSRMPMMNAKEYMKKFGTSYYFANLFFDGQTRKKVYELYAFVRIPDLVVDNAMVTPEAAISQLSELYDRWLDVYKNHRYDDELYGSVAKIFHDHHIDFAYSKAFFDAMIQDVHKKRYETYTELQEYMYGSAEVVGLMMCDIIGCEKDGLPFARKLGEAMQLTNFLRDIKEDYLDFGRIYLPEEDLHRFGVSYKHIKDFCYTGEINEQFLALMHYYIDKCDDLYFEAMQGLPFLRKGSRKAVYIAAKLYQEILRKIQRVGYNVFSHSAKTTRLEKIAVIARYFFGGRR